MDTLQINVTVNGRAFQRRVEPRLRTACVTLTPLLLLSNVCFGWMYESRNYMPLVPLLAVAALPSTRGGATASATGGARRP